MTNIVGGGDAASWRLALRKSLPAAERVRRSAPRRWILRHRRHVAKATLRLM
jgi:hypothetical protein